ncbi:putative plasmid partition protein (fragment) [Flavobacterium psychrophilum]
MVEIPKKSFQKKVQKRKTKTKKKRLKVNQGAGGRFFDDF